ncbi:methyltransferase domain-containing protein [Dactylosporangium sp. CA-092794]|uniref:methyltransferase domain-containing protein n=1 Tax=Dactylosporangium sp. CA-092794 TaxID=3239929 RepID=UPI003D8A1D33
MTTTYLLGAGTSERQRLLVQGEMFRPEAERLLANCTLPPGGRALDVGCGPLGVMDLLAARVGPTGTVVGLDSETRMLDLAAETVTEHGLPGVELLAADAAATGLPRNSFDLTHTRLVLMNVPDADAVLDEMVALTRPGGYVAVQDVDWISRICEPAHPAWDRIKSLIDQLWRVNGMDVRLGRKLAGMLRARGLTDIGVDAAARVFQEGDPYRMLLADRADLCRPSLLERGLISADELDTLIADLRAHLSRPDTIVLHATLFQAWGRVPV